jgi:putative endonuclease
MGQNLILGRAGEEVACKYLASLGYEIRARNERVGRDEIDVLAFDRWEGVLVFAEVKSRGKFDEDFRPELSAGWRKKEKLKRSARVWVSEHGYEGRYRLDLVCVAKGKVTRHIRELSWE